MHPWVKKILHPFFIIPILIIILSSILVIENPPIIDEYIESLLLDYKFKIRNVISPPKIQGDIVCVVIDEKSLARFGRWPWTRILQANLIERIFEGSPRVVGVDIFYSETESTEADKYLGAVMDKYGDRLAIAMAFDVEKNNAFTGEIDEYLYNFAIPSIENWSRLRPIRANKVLLPPEHLRTSARFAHVYVLPDRDGRLRWEILYLEYGGELFPSLSVEVSRIALGASGDSIRIVGGEGVYIGETYIPTDEFGRILINYLGREGMFPMISAADILESKISPDIFRDKIVLIGTSAISTYDIKSTPLSANMTGVEKNATVVSNIIHQDFLHKAIPLSDLIVVLICGVLSILAGKSRSATRSYISYGCLITGLLTFNLIMFIKARIVFNLIYPLMTVILTATSIMATRFILEERKARNIRRMFSSYVTERVVNELIKNPEMARPGGVRREATILFMDIRGFTSFSERNDPEVVVRALNEYISEMTEIILKWEGTIDKFMGDGILAFWGAPLKQENHAELAVRCALEMRQRIHNLREKWKSLGFERLNVGIGLNSGEVIVGNIGIEGKKMEYTVIGDHVNIGSRLEGLTKEFGADILVSEFTLKKIESLINDNRFGHLTISFIGDVNIRGKESQIKIYELIPLEHSN